MIRVAVIGPVEPFRSGVARHTSALARALARHPGTEVRVFSFSRQYPAVLFPGASDRAADAQLPSELDVTYLIDSVNPVTWHSAARAVRAFRPNLVIAPAWTAFLAPCLAFLLHQMRRGGCFVVEIVHNVRDHDAARWKGLLTSIQIRQASAYVTHTRQLAAAIRGVVPDAKVEVCSHPAFEYPAAQGTLPKRAELELLMFGLLRPYKGLDVLLEALSLLKKPSVLLSVVGEAWEDIGEIRAKVARLGLAERVELVPRHVSDSEASEYFARADAVVLPYRSVTGSGVLPLAFYFGKPVVITRLPGFLEFVEQGKTGWSVPVGDAAALAQVIDQEVSREAATRMQADLAIAQKAWSFERYAEVVLKLAGLVAVAGAERPA